MTVADFLRLPPAVRITFVVMLWPAIWAGTGMVVALTTDVMRGMRRHDPLRRDRELQRQRPARSLEGV